jgi:hypothetical protein
VSRVKDLDPVRLGLSYLKLLGKASFYMGTREIWKAWGWPHHHNTTSFAVTIFVNISYFLSSIGQELYLTFYIGFYRACIYNVYNHHYYCSINDTMINCDQSIDHPYCTSNSSVHKRWDLLFSISLNVKPPRTPVLCWFLLLLWLPVKCFLLTTLLWT